VYTTAQAAHDAAAANDIVIIEPSVTSYGDLTLTKPLKIYGNGYFLDINTELKADQRSSLLGTVSFNTGSSGSSVYGIETNSLYVYGVSNINIQRCRIVGAGLNIYNRNIANSASSNVSNINISQNYLRVSASIPGVQAVPTSGFTISNVLVSNNHMNYLLAGDNPSVQNWIIRNNTMYIGITSTLVNSVFENNIMASGGLVSFSNVTYSYNISIGATFSGGVGNQNNFDINPEWSGGTTGISTDEFHGIKLGSPLKTAGSGGTEVGAYGGATPYIVSGIPAIPSTTSLNNTATGSNTVPLQITISVKGNN
jgi:hypothetical protein